MLKYRDLAKFELLQIKNWPTKWFDFSHACLNVNNNKTDGRKRSLNVGDLYFEEKRLSLPFQ